VTRRVACLVLAGPRCSPAAPPGIDGGDLAAAMAHDVYAVLMELDSVEQVVAYTPDWALVAGAVAWTATPRLAVPDASSVAAELSRWAPAEAVLVAPDAPDLPALHLAATFRTLASAGLVASRVLDGPGLVLLGLRLPAPDGLDASLEGLPPAGAVQTPPWRRIRTTGELTRLDPDLEGWEATRQLLGAAAGPPVQAEPC